MLALGAGALALVAFLVMVSPRLRQNFLTTERGVVEADVLATGRFGEQRWVVATELDARSCVVVEFDDRLAGQTCAVADQRGLGPLAVVTNRQDPRWFLLGSVEPGARVVRVTLDDGEQRVLVAKGAEAGHPAGFYATLVDRGVAVTRIEALAGDEVLATLACEQVPVATAAGPTEAIAC